MPCWSSSEEAMTVGEAIRQNGISRSGLWARAVLWPVFILAMALGLACTLYIAETTWMQQKPWRVLTILSWAPYLMVAGMVVSYMDLRLPLAPVAARCALLAVMGVGGSAFGLASFFVTVFGHTSEAIALACALTVALAGLVALWVWVDRTYRAVDSLEY
ncbi:hypothetical protein HU200_039784 [Digitaria exilis]|uniref:DUF7378 domain-containing protein n=1 Tax=Digitaria exilis TaxID=1010633 RepID=A0A835B9U7_9POAL|nr:hypothetical protein HU200_039784 [Digitaria exilis]